MVIERPLTVLPTSELRKCGLFLIFITLLLALFGDFVMRGLLTQVDIFVTDLIFILFGLYLFSPFTSSHPGLKYVLVSPSVLNLALLIVISACMFYIYGIKPNAEFQDLLLLTFCSFVSLVSFQIWNIKRQWRASSLISMIYKEIR